MLNKPNRDKDSLRLNRDKINDSSINISSLSKQSSPGESPTTYRLSIQAQTQGMQIPLSLATPQFNPNLPLHKKLPSSLVESSHSNISIDTLTTRNGVTSYSNNSNDVLQIGVIFEKLKVTKDIIKSELESLPTNSTYSTTNHITEIRSLKRELDIKECMITQLLNTVKEISAVNITQSTKPRPILACENGTKANIISDMKTNQSERKRSMDLTSSDNTVTNSEAENIIIRATENC